MGIPIWPDPWRVEAADLFPKRRPDPESDAKGVPEPPERREPPEVTEDPPEGA